VLLACSGCFTAQGPSASRIRPDTNDRYYPQGDIHFAERGQRSKGVLVRATPGFDSAFSASFVTMLVPTLPSALDGPVWTARNANHQQGAAIANLPTYRNSFHLGLYGNSARLRFGESAVWILSTDPLIVGLPAGEPKRTWREFAIAATGLRDAGRLSPVDPLLARFVVEEELDQPLARVAVFPPGFWKTGAGAQNNDVQLSLVTLPKPLSISQALDALTEGDPMRLGSAERVALHEHFDSERENARSRLADRERLLAR
jgi:hypothetical protein